MKRSDKTHIIKREIGWAIKREGTNRASKIYETKEKAIKHASKDIIDGGDLIIHKKDGTIQEWKSFKKK
ncbi:MAG: hypothetical protein JWN78_1906 [Bacteroidota bacterium]|nr:hypothetical protein [Bacteroidota bacterium]